MPKSTRLALGLLAVSVGLALGCNNETAQNPPPETLPKIHPGGTPPPAAIPSKSASQRPASSQTSAAEQLEAILSEREMFERIGHLAEYLTVLGPEAVDDVKEILQYREFHMGGAQSVLLARFWALHDPAAATRWVLFESPLALRMLLTVPTMELWAMAEPFEAILQLQAMELVPGFNSIAMEMGLISGWFQSETPGLEDYIRGLSIGKSRQRALRFLSRLSIEYYGPEATIDWAISLPEDDRKFKAAAYRQLGMELGKSHPASGVEFCRTQCETEFGRGLRAKIARQWALRDGMASMNWLETAPPGDEKKSAVQGAFEGWWANDRQSLYDWMDLRGPDKIEPWLQPVLESMAIQTGRTDPHRGFEWASAILDNVDRERTYVTIATRWRRKDAESADAWLTDSPLTELSRQRVRIYGVAKPPKPSRSTAPESEPQTEPSAT